MRNSKPRVSIGMPVYNSERFLRPAIESVVTQSFEDFEFIISDNASTDATADICREYLTRDKRIRYFRNDVNIGLYRNVNRVFQLCSGEYFKLAASDDVCHQDLVTRCVQVLDNTPDAVLVYANTTFIDANGIDLPLKDPGWHLLFDAPYERMRCVIVSGHWVNVFFGLMRARALATTRLFPAYIGGDYRLLGELCMLGKFIELPEQLFYRRLHLETFSQDTSTDSRAVYFKGSPGRSILSLWRLCFDHSRTIILSELSLSQRLLLFALLAKRMVGERSRLLNELATASVSYRSWLKT